MSSGSNIDVIRAMLREQKRSCAALHVNPLFREFRAAALRHERQVQQQQHDEEGAAPPPVIDDLDAGVVMRECSVPVCMGSACGLASRSACIDCRHMQTRTRQLNSSASRPPCISARTSTRTRAHRGPHTSV